MQEARVTPADVHRAENAVRDANLKGLQLLSVDPDGAFRVFSDAFTLACDRCSPLVADPRAQRRALAATENNLGLFYHRVKHLDAALAHLARARDIERSLGADAPSPAVTLLNLAQVQTQAGLSREALQSLDDAGRLVERGVASAEALPYEIDKLRRVGARVHASRGHLLESLDQPDKAAVALSAAASEYEKLGMPEDLVKHDELSRHARQLTESVATRPKLSEAPWRVSSVYRTPSKASTAPASGPPSSRPTSARAAARRTKDSDALRPTADAIARASHADDLPFDRVDPVVVDLQSHEPKPEFTRRRPPTRPQTARATAGSRSRPKSGAPRDSAARSGATSRRSSRAMSDLVADTVYNGLDDNHREAYDILAAQLAQADERQATAQRARDAAAAASAAREPGSRQQPPAGAMFSTLMGQGGGSTSAPRTPKPPGSDSTRPWSDAGRPRTARGAPPHNPAHPAPKSKAHETARAPSPGRAQVEVAGAAAERPVDIVKVASEQFAADTVPSQPVADREAAELMHRPVAAEEQRAGASDVGQPSSPDAADPHADAAATKIQAIWRGGSERRNVKTRRERAEVKRRELQEQIREEERRLAREAAAAELASKEQAVEARRRALALQAQEHKKKASKSRAKRDAVVNAVIAVGQRLDELQLHVQSHSVDAQGYLRRAQEEKRQQRAAAITTVQASIRAWQGGVAVTTQHNVLRVATLRTWASRRLRERACATIQRAFRRTIAVRRAAAIAEAKRVAEENRMRHFATSVQRVLRARGSMLLAQRRRSRRLELAVARVQSGVRAARARAEYTLTLRLHREEQWLRRNAAVLIIQHAWRFRQLRVADDAWWAGLVNDQLTGKPRYAATKIQATWRAHRYGKDLRQQWQANLAARRAREDAEERAAKRQAEVLVASRRIQYAYRQRLARRQLQWRRRLNLEARIDYLEDAERLEAALVLAGFWRIVVAKRRVRDEREKARQLELLHTWRREKEERDAREAAEAQAKSELTTRIQSLGRGGRVRMLIRQQRINRVWQWQQTPSWAYELAEVLGRARVTFADQRASENRLVPDRRPRQYTLDIGEYGPDPSSIAHTLPARDADPKLMVASSPAATSPLSRAKQELVLARERADAAVVHAAGTVEQCVRDDTSGSLATERSVELIQRLARGYLHRLRIAPHSPPTLSTTPPRAAQQSAMTSTPQSGETAPRASSSQGALSDGTDGEWWL